MKADARFVATGCSTPTSFRSHFCIHQIKRGYEDTGRCPDLMKRRHGQAETTTRGSHDAGEEQRRDGGPQSDGEGRTRPREREMGK